jgi:hypothetical protein
MTDCGNCWHCREMYGHSLQVFIVCEICGNKRCPHANDHRLECTNSNEAGQPGSAYEFGSGYATVRRLGQAPAEKELNQLKDDNERLRGCLGDILFACARLNWATDGKPETTVAHVREVVRRWEFAEMRLQAATAEVEEWKRTDSYDVELARRFRERAMTAEATVKEVEKVADAITAMLRELADEREDGSVAQLARRLADRLDDALEPPVRVPEDREPQPTDGPDYHAEHAAWRDRNMAEEALHAPAPGYPDGVAAAYPEPNVVCIAHGRFTPCRGKGEHRITANPFWVKSVRDYQQSDEEGLTWEPAWEQGDNL